MSSPAPSRAVKTGIRRDGPQPVLPTPAESAPAQKTPTSRDDFDFDFSLTPHFICFIDGTGKDGFYDPRGTNIFHLFQSAESGVKLGLDREKNQEYHLNYHAGPGAGPDGSKSDLVTGHSLTAIVQDVYQWLHHEVHLREGARLAAYNTASAKTPSAASEKSSRDPYKPARSLISVFGFSRGAFTARVLVNQLGKLGLPVLDSSADGTDELFSALATIYSPFHVEQRAKGDSPQLLAAKQILQTSEDDPRPRCPIDIEALCCFDTVGAYYKEEQIKSVKDPSKTKTVVGSTTERGDDCFWGTPMAFPLCFCDIAHISHAISIDERRDAYRHSTFAVPGDPLPGSPPTISYKAKDDFKNFKTTLPADTECDFAQVYFGGIHSDVGGGYLDHELADLSLAWMVERLEGVIAFDKDVLLQNAITPMPKQPWGNGKIHHVVFPETSSRTLRDTAQVHSSAFSPNQSSQRKADTQTKILLRQNRHSFVTVPPVGWELEVKTLWGTRFAQAQAARAAAAAAVVAEKQQEKAVKKAKKAAKRKSSKTEKALKESKRESKSNRSPTWES